MLHTIHFIKETTHMKYATCCNVSKSCSMWYKLMNGWMMLMFMKCKCKCGSQTPGVLHIQPWQPLLHHLHSYHRLNMDYKLWPLRYFSRIGYLYACSGTAIERCHSLSQLTQVVKFLSQQFFLSMLAASLECPKRLADHQPNLTRSTNS